MITFLRKGTIIILILSFVVKFVMRMFQDVVSLIAVPSGILFVYYLIVFFLISHLNERRSKHLLSMII